MVNYMQQETFIVIFFSALQKLVYTVKTSSKLQEKEQSENTFPVDFKDATKYLPTPKWW